jgi:hypothetical protein
VHATSRTRLKAASAVVGALKARVSQQQSHGILRESCSIMRCAFSCPCMQKPELVIVRSVDLLGHAQASQSQLVYSIILAQTWGNLDLDGCWYSLLGLHPG